ncbi:uncharacterized protein LOC128963566 [Oppia nitens]|uniref:uncharacterized protein LOC128963566 n=1 Tax=Oppia nitens TaxID=1686743 RepID=UPI0023DAF65B|nr:uncharacterized protein LOC128963566 [Oppia nitens]
MSHLIGLNKYQLICKLNETNRQIERLKTSVTRHEVVANLYRQLYLNCRQMVGHRDGTRIRSTLDENERQLLQQMQVLDVCHNHIQISVDRQPLIDTLGKLEICTDKSTQYQTIDISSDTHMADTDVSTNCPKDAQNRVKVSNNSIHQYCHQETDDQKVERLNSTIDFIKDTIDRVLRNSIQIDISDTTDSTDDITDQTDNCDSIDETIDELLNTETIVSQGVSEDKVLVCNYCNKKYKHKKSLDKHISQIHKYLKTDSSNDNNVTNKELKKSKFKAMPKSKKNKKYLFQRSDCTLELQNETQLQTPQQTQDETQYIHQNHCESQPIQYEISHTQQQQQQTHEENRLHDELVHQKMIENVSNMCTECGYYFEDENQRKSHMLWHQSSSVSTQLMNIPYNIPYNPDINLINGFNEYMNYPYDNSSQCSLIVNNSNNSQLTYNKLYDIDLNSTEANLMTNQIFCCNFSNCDYKTYVYNDLEFHLREAHEHRVYTSL